MTANTKLSSRFLSALSVERHEDYETTRQLLSSTPPKILSRNGLAALNLVIDNIKTSLSGKIIIELISDPAISGSTSNKNKKSKSSSLLSNPLANNDFKTGDIVKIDTYPENSINVMKKLKNSSKVEDLSTVDTERLSIEGVITSSNNSKVCVAITNKNDDTSNLAYDQIWNFQALNKRLWIVKISNETTYRRMESTLRKLSEFSLDSISTNKEFAPPIVQYLLGTGGYIPPTVNEINRVIGANGLEIYNSRLNESQKNAIEFALVSPLSIIHGPPGTGKTSTLVEYVIQHLKLYPDKRILITAPSNIAADTIIERLAGFFNDDDAKLVRIGHPARVLQSTRKHTLDYLVLKNGGDELDDLEKDLSKLEKDVRKPRTSKNYTDRKEVWKEIKILKKEFKERSKKGIRDVLFGSKVVVATLHGSGSWEIVSNLYNYDKTRTSNFRGFGKGFFHTVIIDEVSQALEPSCWIPIINHGPDRLVLAGDNKQLPPTIHVSNKKTDRDPELTNKRAFDVLSQSLFDRIVKMYGGNELEISFIKFLDVQYRMCEKCMLFPSEEWYNGKLKADESVKNKKVIDLVKQHRIEGLNELMEKPKQNKRKARKKKKIDEITQDITYAIHDIELDDIDQSSSDLNEQIIWYDTQGGSCPESIESSNDDDNLSKLLNIGGSKYNIGECYIVQKHIETLINLGVQELDIGVIAPYSAQVSRLRSLIWTGKLAEQDEAEDEKVVTSIYPNIEISTVDGFQGREKEIIILSLVRSNFGSSEKSSWGSSDVGFLSDFRRLNVSITRCKKQLTVVGDMETLEQSGISMFKDWCEWCSENSDIRYIDI